MDMEAGEHGKGIFSGIRVLCVPGADGAIARLRPDRNKFLGNSQYFRSDLQIAQPRCVLYSAR